MRQSHPDAGVTPLAGVWIEIENIDSMVNRVYVTPLAGVWIEIVKLVEDFTNDSSSLPLRECGLKYAEITSAAFSAVSLPLRECGLKLNKIPVQTLQ